MTRSTFRNPVRGLLDAIAAIGFAIGAVVLLGRAPVLSPAQLAFGVFVLGVVGLFVVSSLYHGLHWHPHWTGRWQRIDHSMIYVVVSATYTPLAVIVIGGVFGAVVLSLVWGVTALGIAQKIWWPELAHGWSIAAQTSLGWMGLGMIGPLIDGLPGNAVALGLAGGLLYTVGMVIFVTRRPRLWPPHFSYHELFHVFVIAGSASHYAVMLAYVVPTLA